MLKVLLTVLIGLSFHVPASFNQKVVVNITGLRNADGNCNACLFKDANAFPDNASQAVECKTATIGNSRATITFEDVTPGTFAVSVFHDEDSDGELGTNFLGIPKEGYGASKNVLPKMSAPTFEENAFTVEQSDVELEVEIRY